MNPAPGWYPDPRPNHAGLQAYWDGAQWHLKASKLTETAEWVAVGVGILGGMALTAIFPPAVVLVGIGALMYWYYSAAKKKRLREQADWYRQQGPPR